MGRGRAKAKQTKVARQLKYHTPRTDLGALEKELGAGKSGSDDRNPLHDELDDEFDDSAQYADDAPAPDDDRWAPRAG